MVSLKFNRKTIKGGLWLIFLGMPWKFQFRILCEMFPRHSAYIHKRNGTALIRKWIDHPKPLMVSKICNFLYKKLHIPKTP